MHSLVNLYGTTGLASGFTLQLKKTGKAGLSVYM